MPKTSIDKDRYVIEVLGLSNGLQKKPRGEIVNHEYLLTDLNICAGYFYVSENDILSHIYVFPCASKFGELIVKRTLVPHNEFMYLVPLPSEYVHIPTSTLLRNNNWRAQSTKVFEELRYKDAKKTHTKTISTLNGGKGEQVVRTPSYLYSLLDTWFGFDYDPCPVKPEKDAMISEWGMRNFVNPPFSSVQAFIMRAIEQACDKSSMSVLLIPITWMKSTWGYGVLTGYGEYISGCVFLRRGGICFEGYGKAPMPLPMMLLIIQKGGTKPNGIPIEFVDTLPPEKRKLKSRRCTDIKGWLSRIGVI